MKKLLTILLAMWLVEMSVMSGVEASRRPRKRAAVNVNPTPAPVRSVLVNPQPKCEGGQCPLPSQSPRTTTLPLR